MDDKEVLKWLNKNIGHVEDIEKFYNKYIATLLFANDTLENILIQNKFNFDELKQLKKKEEPFYSVLAEEPEIFSFVLEKLKVFDPEPLHDSNIIPDFRKITFANFKDNIFHDRAKNFLTQYQADYSDIAFEKQLIDSVDFPPYHVSQFFLQDATFIKRMVLEEFWSIFLIQLQFHIDYHKRLQSSSAHLFNLIQSHILMCNPAIEKDFIETYFIYERPFYLDHADWLFENGASGNAISYFLEEFAKEQGRNAIGAIMNANSIDPSYELETIYLHSALTQIRLNDSLEQLDDFFSNHFLHKQREFPHYQEKVEAITDSFQNITEIRKDFQYIK